jgi:hypothetical protein
MWEIRWNRVLQRGAVTQALREEARGLATVRQVDTSASRNNQRVEHW